MNSKSGLRIKEVTAKTAAGATKKVLLIGRHSANGEQNFI